MKKIGLIGAGRWSTPYAVSAKQAGAEVVGIYTPDPSAAKLAERIGSTAIDDPRKLMELSDVVLIGSPTDTHADYLAMAAEAGKPALCASPVVSDANQVEKITAKGAGVKAYASFPLRARAEYRRLKKALTDGDLGTSGIFRLGMCRPRPTGWRAAEDRSGGILLETGVHLLDALEWLGGPIERIYGAANTVGDNQYNVYVAKMADGSIAHLEISWSEPEGISYDYYEVSGSKGMLEYDSRREPVLLVEYHDDRDSDVYSAGTTAAQHELNALFNALDGEGVVTDLQHGLEMCRKATRLKYAINEGDVVTF
jgi:predicted dehydrogenase